MNARIALTFLFCFACACSGPTKGDGWKLGDDGGQADVGSPDGGGESDGGGGSDGGSTDGGGPAPGGVTFRMTNGHNTPVFVYGGVAGGLSCESGAWLEIVENGVSQRITSDCGRCSCEETDCAICAFDCAPGADPDYAQIGVGEARVFDWDGLLRVDSTAPDGTTCEAMREPQSDTLTARFCWGHSFETTFDPWGEITEIECGEVEFSPTDDVVEFTVLPTARDGVTFHMTNTTAEMRYASFSAGSPCSPGKWVELLKDGSPLRITEQCGQCSCAEVSSDSTCPQPCPAIACAPPSAELFELQPGAERLHFWNRTAFIDDTVDGISCEHDRLVTGIVTARFCWGTQFDEATFQIADPTCEDVEFDPFATSDVAHDIAM